VPSASHVRQSGAGFSEASSLAFAEVDGASSRRTPFTRGPAGAGPIEFPRFLTTIRCSASSAQAAVAAGRPAPATSTPSSIGDPQRSLGFERHPRVA
jgi:hypothetical protein